MIALPTTRRTAVDRWIASLNPMLDVVQARIQQLGLGAPRINVGPRFVKSDEEAADRIRTGATWHINGKHTGFTVDFLINGIRIRAWNGRERSIEMWATGKITEGSLTRDLKLALDGAGLTHIHQSHELGVTLFPKPLPAAETPTP